MDERCVSPSRLPWYSLIPTLLYNHDMHADIAPSPTAAYQVGLSFLTTHMRRAVATCTSPEVFFSASTSGLKDSVEGGATTDPLSLAMESLNL